MSAITIHELARHRLGRHPQTGADYAEAGLKIMGGCGACGASIAAYSACPSKTGCWLCLNGCIADQGFDTVEAAEEWLSQDAAEKEGRSPAPTREEPRRTTTPASTEPAAVQSEGEEDPDDLPPWAPQFPFSKTVAGLVISAEIWDEIPQVILERVSRQSRANGANRVRLSHRDACHLARKLGRVIAKAQKPWVQLRKSIFLESYPVEPGEEEVPNPIRELSIYAGDGEIGFSLGPRDASPRSMELERFVAFRLDEGEEVFRVLRSALDAFDHNPPPQ